MTMGTCVIGKLAALSCAHAKASTDRWYVVLSFRVSSAYAPLVASTSAAAADTNP
jgi:hypothetical protein